MNEPKNSYKDSTANRAIRYEKYVLRYMKDMLKEVGKDFIPSPSGIYKDWDAYAPMGYDTFTSKPTLVEIKYFSGTNPTKLILSQLIKRMNRFNDESGENMRFLLVTNIERSRVLSLLATNEGKNASTSEILDVLEVNDKELTLRYKDYSKEPTKSQHSKAELIYSFIEDYRNIKNCAFNYTSNFEVVYQEDKIKVTEKNNKHIIYPEFISNLNAIVGRNGAGKTNLCDYISYNFENCGKYFNIYHVDGRFYLYGNFNPFIQLDRMKSHNKSFISLFCSLINGYLEVEDHSISSPFSIVYYKKRIRLFEDEERTNTARMKSYKIGDNSTSFSEKVSLLRKILLGKYVFVNLFRASDYTVFVKVENRLFAKQKINPFINDQLSNNASKNIFLMNIIYSVLKGNNSWDQRIDNEVVNLLLQMNISTNQDPDHQLAIKDLSKRHLNKHDQSIFEKVIDMINHSQFKVKSDSLKFILNKDIKDSDFGDMMRLLDALAQLSSDPGYIQFDLQYLTDGEESILTQFCGIYKALRNIDGAPCILILDEPETSMHPEFSRNYVNLLFSFIRDLGIITQVIISTHSPFILSDVVRGNVMYIINDHEFNISKNVHNTFASNINEMLVPSLFMKSTIGAFAESKIDEVIQYLKMNQSEDQDEYYSFIIENLDDEILRNILKNELSNIRNKPNAKTT
jgi:hypothetical protein